MTFRQRLMYYAFGLLLGLIFTAWFFKDRGCAWTPGNRVLTNIAHSQIMISDSMRCVLSTNGIHDDDVFEIFKTGDVNFSESDPHKKDRMYKLGGTKAKDNKEFEVTFIVHSDSITVLADLTDGKKGDCLGLSSSPDRIFTMPEKTVKKILKTKEVIASDSLKAVIKGFKIPEGQVRNMVQFGKINFDKSQPMAKPHAIYYLTYGEFELSIELAEERAYVLSITKK